MSIEKQRIAKAAYILSMTYEDLESVLYAAKETQQPVEMTCLKSAEESLLHHGYNPATNRDVARICFNAMRGSMKRESGGDK